MSGSPKHSQAWVQEQLRRQAEEERAQRAREEAERRAAIERQRAEERRDRVRQQAGAQAAGAIRELDALLGDPSGRFVPPDAGAEVRRRLEQSLDEARSAPDEAAAQAGLRRVAEAAALLGRLGVQARSAAEAAAGLDLELAELGRELDRLAQGPLAGYLPAGGPDDWRGRLDRLRRDATTADHADAIRRGLGELGQLRSAVRRSAAEAEAVARDAAAVRAELSRARSEADGFASGEVRAFAEPGRFEPLDAQIREHEDRLARATDREAVAALRRGAAQLRDDLRRMAEAAAAAQRAAHLDQEAQALVRLRGEVAGLDAGRSQKFDPAGWGQLQALLAQVDGALQRKEVEPARRDLAAARGVLGTHGDEVARRFRRWQDERERAVAAQAAAQAQMAAIRQDADRMRWSGAPAFELDRRLRELDRLVEREEFAAARQQAAQVEREAAELARAADLLHAESTRVAEVRGRIAAAQPLAGQAFDADGARDLARLLEAAEAALKQHNLAEAQRLAGHAQERLARHEREAAQAADRWREERDAAAAALGAALGTLAAMREDPVVGRWQSAALDALARQLERAQADLDRGRFADVMRAAERVPAEAKKLVEAAGQQQLQADLQARIADGIARVMGDMGFRVVPGREDPADPRSAIILQASRENGDLVAVAVEHEGRLEYDVGGRLEKREEIGVAGRPVRRCDEAEGQIRQMHEILLTLGIGTTDLEWDDQPDPDDGVAAVADSGLSELRRTQRRARAARR